MKIIGSDQKVIAAGNLPIDEGQAIKFTMRCAIAMPILLPIGF